MILFDAVALQAWLQEFAWVSRDVPARQKALARELPSMNVRLRLQPIFCIETALKMVLWSSLVYESECSEGRIPAVGSEGGHSPEYLQEKLDDSDAESVNESARSSGGLDHEVRCQHE